MPAAQCARKFSAALGVVSQKTSICRARDISVENEQIHKMDRVRYEDEPTLTFRSPKVVCKVTDCRWISLSSVDGVDTINPLAPGDLPCCLEPVGDSMLVRVVRRGRGEGETDHGACRVADLDNKADRRTDLIDSTDAADIQRRSSLSFCSIHLHSYKYLSNSLPLEGYNTIRLIRPSSDLHLIPQELSREGQSVISLSLSLRVSFPIL